VSDKPGDWTALGVLSAAVNDVRRHPIPNLFLLGVVPVLWAWGWNRLVESSTPHTLDFAHLALAVVRRLGSAAWGSVLLGGQSLIAIDVARGAPPRPTRLIQGLRYGFPVFLSAILTGMLLQANATLVAFSRAHPGPLVLLVLLVLPMTSVILVRSIACVPLVVDRNCSFLVALWTSWAWTRGQSWRIVRVYLLFLPVFFVALVTHKKPLALHLVWPLLSAIGSMMWAQVYLRLADVHGASLGAPPLHRDPNAAAG
jgi:hypothetical protein